MHNPYWDYVRNLDNLAKEFDADITEWDWFDKLDGVVYKSDKYHIWVKKSLNTYQKRFTIAHELAHIATNTVDSQHNKYSEQKADKIATNILIADEDFLQILNEYGWDFSYLCPIFGVSPEIIEKKFYSLFPRTF